MLLSQCDANAILACSPDLIFISAGFDAHRKDDINFRYIGIQEKDYEWLTDQIVQVSACFAWRVLADHVVQVGQWMGVLHAAWGIVPQPHEWATSPAAGLRCETCTASSAARNHPIFPPPVTCLSSHIVMACTCAAPVLEA